MDQKRKALKQWAEESRSIVFFGGAGVSTESGIPDFRSVDGLYHQQYDDPPETILSRTYFDASPAKFYKFYRSKMLCLDAKPNAAHQKLAQWEQEGRLRSVVTQNIDGLHQAAGSRRVWELHGSVLRNYCMKCHAPYSAQFILDSKDEVPRCTCGGIIKPDVVLYEEALDSRVLQGAVTDIQNADLLIIGGTSLAVYPAAGLIRYFPGKRLVLINRSSTPFDQEAALVFHDSIGEVLGGL